jgi:hypothetical protein
MQGAVCLCALALVALFCGPATPTMAQSCMLPGIPAMPASAGQIPAAPGHVYYVRPDGGNADQCTGLVDAPYPGGGNHQPCAWDHPFRALQPSGEAGVPGTVRIAGGDTLIIAAGSYRLGYGAPGAENCRSDYPWDCVMPAVPSGPDPAHPTRILGRGWDAGCPHPPELWGAEGAAHLLDLSGTRNAEIRCLEITDHAACAYGHTGGLACPTQEHPYGDWAAVGLYAVDAANIVLRDLNIHGLANQGVWAGRLADWTVERVRIAGNGWAGWDGDIDGDDSNSGTLTFRHWTVEWNGCVEKYPSGEPSGCWAQTAGGYGDGVGTGETGGHWIIEDSAFLHNTSDGLDLLYARRPGSLVEIRRTLAQDNAGNQIKTNGSTRIENSVIIGNCGYFEQKPFTYHVDSCRAAGNTLALTLRPGSTATLVNNTLTGEGDCLVELLCEGSCTQADTVRMRNNIFLGQADFLQPFEKTCFVYWENFPSNPVDTDYTIIHNVKDSPCPVGGHDICRSPALANEALAYFDAHLRPGSPAIDAGTPDGAPTVDLDNHPRDAQPDIGAYEFLPAAVQLWLPLVLGATG